MARSVAAVSSTVRVGAHDRVMETPLGSHLAMYFEMYLAMCFEMYLGPDWGRSAVEFWVVLREKLSIAVGLKRLWVEVRSG